MATHSGEKLPLTALVLCFNEERNIEACLASVADWVDELLVVDSFSTDRTLEIARRYTSRILQHEYGNQAAQSNWAIPQARHEWVLLVDSDERVSPRLRQEIEALLRSSPDKDGYWIYRNNYLFGRRIRHSGWGRDSVLRLFRRDVARYAQKRVHAEVELERTGTLRGRLEHHTVSSISAWAAKINRYTSWKAEDKFERGFPAARLQLFLRPPLRFLKDMIFRLGILDGWRGFLIAGMSALAEMQVAAKVLELRYQAGSAEQSVKAGSAAEEKA